MRGPGAVTIALGAVLVATVPAFSRVFVDDAWRGRYLAAGLLALVVAAVVRRLGGGGLVALAVSLLGLTLFTYVTALPAVGLLPDASSLTSFVDLLEQATTGLREEIAPVVALPGFVVAIATGAWLVAHLAHELAVRFRRPGAALVPITVLWALPLAVPMDDAGSAWLRALPFLAAAGLVLLLGGQQVEDESTAGSTASGVSVGAAALALTALAPLLLPGYAATAWVDLSGPESPRGYQPIVDVTERLQLPAEREVLRVRASERTYLRLAGLDSFDGGTWRLGPSGAGTYQPDESSLYRTDAALPPESPARATVPVQAEVDVLDLANIYVPTPYQPVAIRGDLTREMVWSTEGGFLATFRLSEDGSGTRPRVGVSEGVSYQVDAQRPAPTLEQLRAVELDDVTRERWTRLPRDYERLAQAAADVYAAAGAETDVDRALALQDWFTDGGRFTYDLDVPALRADDALERFVLEERRGYCEYFATAMAVMLRASGIPARVAVGFLPGRVTSPADVDAGRPLTEFSVTTSDAHAWVEVLFPGYGWVTFEPTPRSDQTQLVPTAEDLAPVENLRERRLRELAELDSGEQDVPAPDTPDPVPTTQPNAPAEEPTSPTGGSRGAADGVPGWVPWAAVVGALLAVALALVVRGRRAGPATDPATRVLGAQRSLLARARRYGVGRRPHETATEVVGRWHEEGRVGVEAGRFAAIAQAAAFGGEVDAAVALEAERLVAEIEDELRASVPARDRVLSPVRAPVERVTAGARRAGTALLTRVGDRRAR